MKARVFTAALCIAYLSVTTVFAQESETEQSNSDAQKKAPGILSSRFEADHRALDNYFAIT